MNIYNSEEARREVAHESRIESTRDFMAVYL